MLCIYNVVVPRATTEKVIQRDNTQKCYRESKWNSKTCLSNPQEGRKKTDIHKKQNRKQKVKW